MAKTDSLQGQELVRLVSVPYDALLPWEKDVALGFVRRMADEISESDLAVVLRDRHSVPDWGPPSYATVVLEPAVEEDLMSEAFLAAWQARLAGPHALDDPRVRVFCARRASVVLEWHLELERRARLVARLLRVDSEAVAIQAFDHTNGRALWLVEGMLYLVHEGEERLAVAADYIASHPLLGLDYPEAVAKVSRIPEPELARLKQLRETEPAEAHSSLVTALEGNRVAPEEFAAAVLSATEDWVPFLTARLADDGVEYLQDDVSLVKILELNPDVVDDTEDDDDDPAF